MGDTLDQLTESACAALLGQRYSIDDADVETLARAEGQGSVLDSRGPSLAMLRG